MVLTLGHFQARLRFVQRVQRPLYVDIGIAAGQPLLGACFGFARTLYIDLGRALGGLGQNCHFVGQHFRESPRHCKALLVTLRRGT